MFPDRLASGVLASSIQILMQCQAVVSKLGGCRRPGGLAVRVKLTEGYGPPWAKEPYKVGQSLQSHPSSLFRSPTGRVCCEGFAEYTTGGQGLALQHRHYAG